MNDQLAALVAQLKERRANTFQERIKSLDIRDEIWRKYVELNKGSSFDAIAAQRTGLCPDMCCERERLTREYQRLYKSYEIDSDTRALSHSLMVTEYSRASADQAMPSPYDLRSGRVLLQTMNYLITNIMDKFDYEREQGDWYNFLWDRLRAIRKELTQQHLRDENAVEILEQCARFHIFCSAFLSGYSRDLFDPNLNDKMLIDCLNQLRDCYLTHKKQNNYQTLKNLAEFSSYMLLINLKDDNETLLRIRRLIQDITDVSEIDVALNIHRALLLSNTTKFFSLIESQATLLQSCLLNRYFTIIRLKRLSLLIASTRSHTDEFRLSDLTEILGMDDDDETKDFLEQLGYTVTNTGQSCLVIPAGEIPFDQRPVNKLSQKLIKSKYDGNLKDIITGYANTPVIIPDTNVEDSFDLQGCFIGRIPFDLDKTNPSILFPASAAPPPIRRPMIEQPSIRPSTANPLATRRPPLDSSLRSLVSTTTPNTFLIKTRPMSSTNRFTTAPTPSPFGGFTQTTPSTSNSIFASPPRFPSSFPSTKTISYRPQPVESTSTPVSILKPTSKTPEVTIQPATPTFQPPTPPPVARRLSVNSMDAFINDLYDELIDPFIRETTYTIFDEFITQWNKLIKQTVNIFNEFLTDELSSIASDYYNQVNFHQKMFEDTIREENERKRKKYLSRKYSFLWLDKTIAAREERSILTELQLKYHFLTNEQLFEFLTGIQLIVEHDFTLEQTTEIFKSRRLIKRTREQKLTFLSNFFFEEFLHDEFDSIVRESNAELDRRKQLFDNALNKQAKLKREHYLQMKYFSLWFSTHQKRKKSAAQQRSLKSTTNKRLNRFFQLRSNKKLKENIEQYQTIKHSFDQLTTDLNQIQLILDKLNS